MLKVSGNHRFLINDDGRPFFYLGDTAWELFHRLDLADAELYLRNRAAKGFTVIQAVALAEKGGLTVPNANGDVPFEDMDITRPNEAYFKHVDDIVNLAAKLGLHVGMLPTWGDKVGPVLWGEGPEKFINESNARAFGKFMGARYANAPIIWILGGDRPAEGYEQVWREMAAGIKEGDGDSHLMSYHPSGAHHSSTYFHNDPWLDLNMYQSGHGIFTENFLGIEVDYAKTPPKPCMDAEPGYEDIPNGPQGANGYINDYHVRMSAYWSLFAGAHGHTYGCHPIWWFADRDLPPMTYDFRRSWRDAMDLPGASQMTHVRALMESRPFLTRIPDQSIVAAGQKFRREHISTTRDGTPGKNDATYVMAYFPIPRQVTIDIGRIAANRIRGWWFDPRSGDCEDIGVFDNPGCKVFTTPGHFAEDDWVLVLDNADSGYPPPGQPWADQPTDKVK